MENRPPFEAEHNSICASADVPILEFYQGYFESVYIIFHPFYKTNNQGKITEIISWRALLELTGFSDIHQLDIALRNSIGGLKDKWKNNVDVGTLDSVCIENNIERPCEGQFQEALESEMALALQEQGHHYLFVADEYGYERKLAYIQDFVDGIDNTVLYWGAQRNWYTNKHEILFTTHWDSHFTLLCSDSRTIESILEKHPFEGFYYNAKTEIYWSCRGIENNASK